jgi:hypothetical protein
VYLATDYPVWFTLLFRALLFLPVFPGLIMYSIAVFRGKSDAYMWSSLVILVIGILIVMLFWERNTRGGHIYGIF